jgi:hypothetical protein
MFVERLIQKQFGIAAIPFITTGCMVASGCCMQGSGHITEESRAIESFDKIRIELEADVVISYGQTDTIEIQTDDNLMDHVETRVVDNTLLIKSDVHECLDSTKMEIRVSTPSFSELKIDGSSDVRLDGAFASESILLSIDGSANIQDDENLSADLLSVHIDGSGKIDLKDVDVNEIGIEIDGAGDIHLAGIAPIQTIDIDGSGEIDAYGLETKSTSIGIDGSGTCKVNVTETLTVHIDGSSEVYFLGSPSVEQSIDGSGIVKPAK